MHVTGNIPILRLHTRFRHLSELEVLAEFSPKMVDILRQGDEDIKNGRGRVVTLDEI